MMDATKPDSEVSSATRANSTFFREHLVAEVFFACLILFVIGVGTMLGLHSEFLDAIALIGLLLLGAELVIRWRLSSIDREILSLNGHMRRYGLPVSDHLALGHLAASYLDERAGDLASLQREFATRGTIRVPVHDIHTELIRILRLAQSHCTEIRAVASKDLEEYAKDGVARNYFIESVEAGTHFSTFRIFVLDREDLSKPSVRDLIDRQNNDLLAAKPVDEGVRVKWMYRPENTDDRPYLENRVPTDYRPDWVLFGSALLVRHDVAGEGWAEATIDPTEITKVLEKFKELWGTGRPPDRMREVEDAGKPKRDIVPRSVPLKSPSLVSARAEDVVSDPAG
jgi:hypothetical protein